MLALFEIVEEASLFEEGVETLLLLEDTDGVEVLLETFAVETTSLGLEFSDILNDFFNDQWGIFFL